MNYKNNLMRSAVCNNMYLSGGNYCLNPKLKDYVANN